MDIFKGDIAEINPLLEKILPREMLTENVFKLDVVPTSSGSLAHYSPPGDNPGSKGTFYVNKNVTMFNKVISASFNTEIAQHRLDGKTHPTPLMEIKVTWEVKNKQHN